MGSTGTGRSPIVYFRPGEGYFQAGLLLCVAFGIGLAGVEESFRAADWAWFWFFTGAEIICLVLYFWIVLCWVRWIDHTDDYKNVYGGLPSSYDHDKHPGEFRDS
jgi:hypothetical protein